MKLKAALAILFAIMLIVVTYSVLNQLVSPLDFKLSLSSANLAVNQGENATIEVLVSHVSGKTSNVNLTTASTGSLGCTFGKTAGVPTYTSTLTVNVPNSTAIGYYTIDVIATDGNTTETASCSVAVLSAQVLVSGNIQFYFGPEYNSPFSIYPFNLTFVDTENGASYTTTPFSFDGYSYGWNYSITLGNQHTYNVTLFQITVLGSSILGAPGQPKMTPTGIYLGNISVYAGAGNSTQTCNITKEFS